MSETRKKLAKEIRQIVETHNEQNPNSPVWIGVSILNEQGYTSLFEGYADDRGVVDALTALVTDMEMVLSGNRPYFEDDLTIH